MTHFGTLDWVLVLAPYRRDAEYLEQLLIEHQIVVRRSSGIRDLEALLSESPGVLVATHEALNPEVLGVVAKFLADQPNWSEIPIVILLDRAAKSSRIRSELSAVWQGSRQLYYQRPLAALELLSGIQSALLARQRQREVRDHIEREIELRYELNHRIKNILASIISIFEMTRRGAESIDDLTRDFRGRLDALANVHSAVFQAGGTAIDLASVFEMTFMPYRTGEKNRIKTDGPPITVSREVGTTLALSFHELATNAIKYGALSRPGGHIRLSWELSSESETILTMRWAENGGPQVSKPSRSGYGTRFIHSALEGLFGSPPVVDFRPEGLHLTIAGPLSRIAFEVGAKG
jgi:two-component sensor histidine kinase